MFQIEWKSAHYHSDGRKRSRPKASTVHGWLVKWRATFSGNESLRKEGIREMLEAKLVREAKRKRRAARGGAKSPLSLSFFFGKKKKRSQRSHTRSRSHNSKHSARSITTRCATSPVQSPKPSHYQQSAYHSRHRHPSRSQSRGYSRHSSRQASYDSGRTLVRSGTIRTKQQ
ncbi:hypothetical protein SCLCIDRAFT_899764 [Scleroderma citrinum Foug A]|uniref:Uncharacterized protein n=1 Tax=Scleroderma citrinum Foug A TaxID=1036808 RepID=A0A0C3EKX7_9AGAM|nr:hypothetical protein SCLCIDRAFT_899764 [Scleroderma citrinum Foug A]